MLDPRMAVGDLVLAQPACASVLSRHRIDFCRGGARALVDACAALGEDVVAVVTELEQAIGLDPTETLDPRTLSTPDLILRVIGLHHHYLRETLPFLRPLVGTVARLHGDRDPALRRLEELTAALSTKLLDHLQREDRDVFRRLIAGDVDEELLAELARMRADHDEVVDLLAQMRVAAHDYAVPAWACNRHRTLYGELVELEADTLAHLHVENAVLFPRFTARGQRRRARDRGA
jgi:regulator of cell morphogenesis and NO signaling